MPEIRWSAVTPTTKAFPVWGPTTVGRTGERRCDLLVEGSVVSRRYRAQRSALVTYADGVSRLVRVAGSGGHFTSPSQRRKGYAATLEEGFLDVSAHDGFDLAMLFCLEPLVRRNRQLGWHMIPGSAGCVTYTQPGTERPVPCPVPVWTGLRSLTPALPDPASIQAVHVEGLPW